VQEANEEKESDQLPRSMTVQPGADASIKAGYRPIGGYINGD